MKFKKSLLTLALYTLTPLSFAQNATPSTIIYGTLSPSVDYIISDRVNFQNRTTVSDNDSFIGFKGYEDLGQGSYVSYDIQSTIAFSNQSNTTQNLTLRNAWLAAGNKELGSIKIGQFETPFRRSLEMIDPFLGQNASSMNLMGNFASAQTVNNANGDITSSDALLRGYFNRRQANQFQYTSPMIDGFQGTVAMSGGQNLNGANSFDAAGLFSSMLSYTNPLIFISYAYERQRSFGNQFNTDTGHRISASAKIHPDVTLMGGIEHLTIENFGQDNSRNAITLAATTDLDTQQTIKVAYTKAQSIDNLSDSGAQQISLGYTYKLSKRTQAFANYTHLANDANGLSGFARAALTPVSTGETLQSVGLGIKHQF